MRQIINFSILVLLLLAMTPSRAHAQDLVVKVVKDDLIKNKKFMVSVMKNGTFKSLDDKYSIMKFDLYILNSRGETKWYKTIEREENMIDLNKHGIEIAKGDLIVIDNIELLHKKNGRQTAINRITERYLIK